MLFENFCFGVKGKARRACALVVLMSTGTCATAQTAEERETYMAGTRALEHLLGKFQAVLPQNAAGLRLSESVEISFDKNYGMRTDLRRKRILISVRFIQQTLMTLDAAVYAGYHKDASKKLIGYHWLLHSELMKPIGAGFTSFWTWRKLSPPNSELTAHMQRVRDEQIINMLAFPIAHEVGHLVRNHLASSSVPRDRSNTQEFEADSFARQLLTDAQIPLLPALAAQFPRYFVQEAAFKRALDSSAWTHPSTSCRVAHLVNAEELAALSSTPTYYLLMGAISGLSPRALAAELDDDKAFCNEFNVPATTFVDPPNCPDIASLVATLVKSPKSLHGGEKERFETGDENSTPRTLLDPKAECSLYTSDANDGSEYYSYECEWRLGLGGAPDTVAAVAKNYAGELAACFGAQIRNYARAPRIKWNIKAPPAGIEVQANAASKFPKLSVRIKGINEKR